MPLFPPLCTRQFPVRCELCGGIGPHSECLCAACQQDLPRINKCCFQCGRAMLQNSDVCGQCLAQPWFADRTIAAFQYQYPLDRLIIKLKYKQCISLVSPLAGALSSRLSINQLRPLPEVMVPVPLHYLRLYSRGFNQSVEVCRILGRRLNIPVDLDIVERIRNTKPMINLTAEERSKNIRAAFKLTRRLPYRSIAIVDDVITSGSTVNELARLFRLAGAAYIEFWALARAD